MNATTSEDSKDPKDPAAQKAQAEAEKAQADAAKAKAEARSAEAKARKDEREVADNETDAARRRRDAETSKATAEADKDAATARQGQLAALIPDVSKVDRGTLEGKGDQALFGVSLALSALDAAATTVAGAVTAALGSRRWRMLVTSDAALATSDAAYVDVVTGLDQLNEAAKHLIEDTAPARATRLTGTPLDVVAALATAVPPVLSLLSARRTVTTALVSVTDLAAAAAVAGALKPAPPQGVVVHDDVRLLPEGMLRVNLAKLSDRRQKLTARKIALEDAEARSTAELGTSREAAKVLQLRVDAADEATKPTLQAQLYTALEGVRQLEAQVTGGDVRIGLIDSILAAIDAFTASLYTIGPNAERSPLALAAMREQLHVGTPVADQDQEGPWFTHVLLVKGAGGSTQQIVEDRPLLAKDQFSVVATASITYILLETAGSAVLAAGNASGSAEAHGTVGKRFAITQD
jgi:hypothetical protein